MKNIMEFSEKKWNKRKYEIVDDNHIYQVIGNNRKRVKNIKIQKYKFEINGRVIYIVAVKDFYFNDIIYINMGYSLLHPEDVNHQNDLLGYEIALNRALKKEKYVMNVTKDFFIDYDTLGSIMKGYATKLINNIETSIKGTHNE